MSTPTSVHPPIVSSNEWRARRVQLLAQEKELTKHYDRVSAERRRLPMVRVEKDYVFEGPAGKVRLADMFEGRSQLIVYHFMFDPERENACPGCTGYIDAIGDISMLNDRNTTFAMISRSPQSKLSALKAKKGWTFPWYSSFGNDFNYDFHTTLDESVKPVEYNYRTKAQMVADDVPSQIKGEAHALSVFFLLDGQVYHVNSTYARGVERLADAYALLDMTPFGRQEDWEESPAGWPQKPTYGG